MRTAEDIIIDAITDGLGLPRTGIQNDVLQEAVSQYNFCARTIWDAWPWDSKKIDQFDTDNATYVNSYNTTTGIIVFEDTVDLVRAIQAQDTTDNTEGTFVWNENDVNSAIKGVLVSDGHFVHLADASDGKRRIRISADDNVDAYNILATKRFVKATIESTYDSGNPNNTPTDYRVIEFPLDKADQALQAYMADQLRLWDGQPKRNDWAELLQIAISTHEKQAQRSAQYVVPSPAFGDVGRFQYGGQYGINKTY